MMSLRIGFAAKVQGEQRRMEEEPEGGSSSSSGVASAGIKDRHKYNNTNREIWAPPSDRKAKPSPAEDEQQTGELSSIISVDGSIGAFGMRSGCDNDSEGNFNEPLHLNQLLGQREQLEPTKASRAKCKLRRIRSIQVDQQQQQQFDWRRKSVISEQEKSLEELSKTDDNIRRESLIISDNRHRTRSRRCLTGGQQTSLEVNEGKLVSVAVAAAAASASADNKLVSVEELSISSQVSSALVLPKDSINQSEFDTQQSNKSPCLLRKRGERSSSVTSDYYSSSNQNSPQIVSSYKISNNKTKPEVTTYTNRKLDSNNNNNSKKTTTIYENPLFGENVKQAQVFSVQQQQQQRNTATTKMRSGKTSDNKNTEKGLNYEAMVKSLRREAASVNVNSNYANDSSDLRTQENNNKNNGYNKGKRIANNIDGSISPQSPFASDSNSTSSAATTLPSSSSLILLDTEQVAAAVAQVQVNTTEPMQICRDDDELRKQSADRLLINSSPKEHHYERQSTVSQSQQQQQQLQLQLHQQTSSNNNDNSSLTESRSTKSVPPSSHRFTSSVDHKQGARNNTSFNARISHEREREGEGGDNKHFREFDSDHVVCQTNFPPHLLDKLNSPLLHNSESHHQGENPILKEELNINITDGAIVDRRQIPARRQVNAMEEQHQHNYYYAPQQHSSLIYQNNSSSQASGSQTTTTGGFSESTSNSQNTDEYSRRQSSYLIGQHQHSEQSPAASSSDYHYYQVLVPPVHSPTVINSNSNHVAQQQPVNSPCKSIQRIVSSLFAHNQQDHRNLPSHQQQHQQPPIPTINQNLVINEPLIRSSSWQNKTLIDLRLKPAQQQQQQVHYLESSLIKTLPSNSNNTNNSTSTLLAANLAAAAGGGANQVRYTQFPPTHLNSPPAIELSSSNNYVNQPQQQEHFYNTLNRGQQQQQNHLFKGINEILHPHLTTDKITNYQFSHQQTMQIMGTQHLMNNYHHHLHPSETISSPLSGISSTTKFKRSSKDSSFLFKNLHFSKKFCLFLLLLLASGCLLLAALFSSTQTPAATSFEHQSKETANKQLLNTYEHDLLMIQSMRERGTRLPINTNELLAGNSGSTTIWPLNEHSTLTEKRPLAPSGGWFPSSLGKKELNDNGLPITNGQQTPTTTFSPITTTQSSLPLSTSMNEASSTQRYWLRFEPNNTDKLKGEEGGCLTSSECNLKGHCDEGTCFCYAGFSGPNCAIVNCPNECSQNGECKLKQDSPFNYLNFANGQLSQSPLTSSAPHLQSIAFQTNHRARSRNSICPKYSDNQQQQQQINQSWPPSITGGSMMMKHSADSEQTFDNRLEWNCVCDLGFSGLDCSQLKELQCDNKLDDDNDGLIDCEDDDCCSQPVCSINHMCFKSPEPIKALELWKSPATSTTNNLDDQKQQHVYLDVPLNYTRSDRFFAQLRFMIDGPKPVLSYAKERAFDKSRVSVVRGRVVKWSNGSQTGVSNSPDLNTAATDSRGIVSVRVGVAENLESGFTLTRDDGSFDMLVNGDEWITLQFNKNNYAPIKRRVFVKANSFVLLEERIEMWLIASSAGSSGGAGSGGTVENLQMPELMSNSERANLDQVYNLQSSLELHKFVSTLKRFNNEQDNNTNNNRNNLPLRLFDCMINSLSSKWSNFRSEYEPTFLEEPSLLSASPSVDNLNRKRKQQRLKSFVLASSGAYSSSLGREDKESQFKPRTVYNSAFFPPTASVVKPTISVQLLGAEFKQQEAGEVGAGAQRLRAILVQLNIEGQERSERLAPLPRLIYQFAWNRRNVYQQKVYGFGQLNVRIGYEYELLYHHQKQQHHHSSSNNISSHSLLSECLSSSSSSLSLDAAQLDSSAFDKLKSSAFSNSRFQLLQQTMTSQQESRRVVWFEQKIYMEAHHLNQHSDIGKWTLDKSNRLDQARKLIYFGSGWSLPYKLVYPPTISKAIPLLPLEQQQNLSKQQPKPLFLDQRQSFFSASVPASVAQAHTLMSGHIDVDVDVDDDDFKLPIGSSRRHMTRGPNSSTFVVLFHPEHAPLLSSQLIQLDSTGRRRLLDVPLSILTNKLGLAPTATNSASAPATDQFSSTGATSNDLIANDIQILYNNYLSTLYLSSRSTGKMVQVSYSSLLVLNKTLSSGQATAASADDAIDIEPLCGFGRHLLNSNSPAEAIRPARLVRLTAPHSMTLDEQRQLLYFIDGTGSIMALDLVSHRLALLSIFGQSRNVDGSTGSGECSRQAFRVPLQQYKVHQAHGLTWSKADSTLYFVDQNLVFGLRQDFNLELVLAGRVPATRTALAAQFHTSFQGCFGDSQLGSIRILLADELNGDLLLVHQQHGRNDNNNNNNDNKISGNLYLAKLKLATTSDSYDDDDDDDQRANNKWSPLNKLIDLHSAKSAWNPMILRLAEDQIAANSSNSSGNQRVQLNGTDIQWEELATTIPIMMMTNKQHQIRRPLADEADDSSGHSSRLEKKLSSSSSFGSDDRIPFIHLSGGFERIDSVEIQPDGSIFVLESSGNSIMIVAPYEPNEFNLVERFDVNINRLFATTTTTTTASNNLEPSQQTRANGQQQEKLSSGDDDDDDELTKTEVENRKLNVLIVQNPISGELMEFHSNSGLQLSLTSSSSTKSGKRIKSEFYYKILTNNKMVELDEDDKYDFDVQKTLLNYMTANGNLKNHLILNQVNGAYVRLNKILDSIRNEYELVRLYTGSRFVLQTILFNHQPMCELATDYSGVLITYQEKGKNYWFEMNYDSSTYLLRDMIIKVEGGVQSTNLQQQTRDLSGSRYDNINNININNNNNGSSDTDSMLGRAATKDWRQLKRIVYDRIFYHYCDLFIVNA